MIRALILAAGESRRMGRAKLLLPFANSSIIETVIQTALASQVDEILVVLGAGAENIREKIRHLDVSLTLNSAYRDGMFSSIQCGFRDLPADTSATMLLLGDQPGIPATVIDRIITEWRDSGKNIILPRYGKRNGHPLLVDMSLREEILRSDLVAGMYSFMQNNSAEIREISVNNAAILEDIDTPKDYDEQVNKA